MKLLSRYIARTILTATLLVLLVLLGLYTFIDFVTELEDLGKGSYQLAEIFSYIALSMPKRIYELLPIAALLGSVLGLGTLASQSELVAMRAAGISVMGINKAVMAVALILMVVAVFMGEVLRPVMEQKALELQSVAQTGTVGTHSENGFWTRDGLYFNHISQITSDGQLMDVTVYEFDKENRLKVVMTAENAKYSDQSWTLENVVQSIIDEKQVKVRTVKRKHWESQLNPGLLNIVVVEPEYLPVWELLPYVDYLDESHQASESYELAFWSKIMMPLSSAVMVFLAVPFIFGPLRSSSIGGRILVGAIVGIGFYLFNQTFQHTGLVYGFPPILSAVFPTIAFAVGGIYLMRRVH